MTTHWEPATNVSYKLIEEYERTANADIVESHASGGQTIHTVSTSSCERPDPKKPRIDISDTDKGYVLQYNVMQYGICAMITYINVMH